MNLLGRAAALLDEDEPARPALLSELAGALSEAGEFGRMQTVLGQALEGALASEDRRLEAYVLIQRAFLLIQMGGESEGAIVLAERTIPLFEGCDDDLGLARAWHLIGEAEFTQGRTQRAGDAWKRGLERARKAGDRREEAELLVWLAMEVVNGPTTVSKGLARLDAILAEGRGDQRVTAAVTIGKALLVAMQGRFDEARTLIGRGQVILEDLGLRVRAAMAPAAHLGQVELLAGDSSAAEAAFRPGFEALERMGEKSFSRRSRPGSPTRSTPKSATRRPRRSCRRARRLRPWTTWSHRLAGARCGRSCLRCAERVRRPSASRGRRSASQNEPTCSTCVETPSGHWRRSSTTAWSAHPPWSRPQWPSSRKGTRCRPRERALRGKSSCRFPDGEIPAN